MTHNKEFINKDENFKTNVCLKTVIRKILDSQLYLTKPIQKYLFIHFHRKQKNVQIILN